MYLVRSLHSLRTLNLLTIAAAFFVSLPSAHAQVGDTVHSHKIKTITAFGQYFGIDRTNHENIILKVMAMNYVMVAGAPELACFVANHAKDNLRITYQIWEYEAEGKTNRWMRAISILTEKGEQSSEWAAKERADSTLMERHHKILREAVQLSTGSD